ncbi:uncharacterized protein (DUF2267 family) [Rhizobium sp. SG_E_25_P2]|uniref:DUF2267 domain-containing protein n=1 Tax=Rhizobium sp. SG_E_25_P2 TaxID=2879942 RepID=UPI00247433BE|nr:DUF2267 domain-containing protein [Rhizobium sp. SG_E_25_P2]MDH6265478.1 uncharacterized protein (DUF2267 family) [Rhizobium sp. SG_E_25_P2]
MTVPTEYAYASRDFDRFMIELLDLTTLETRHRAYAVTRAVLHVFRAHLTVADALVFADALPAVLRAIFVENWRPVAETPPFPDRAELSRQVRANRRDHNLADDDSILAVARALRASMDQTTLDRALAPMPEAARNYWAA